MVSLARRRRKPSTVSAPSNAAEEAEPAEATAEAAEPEEGTGGAATGGNASNEAGAQVFASNGCGSCHTFKAANSTGTTGPDLNEYLAPDDDKAGIEEMIVDPNAEIAEGYSANVMPKNYGQSISKSETRTAGPVPDQELARGRHEARGSGRRGTRRRRPQQLTGSSAPARLTTPSVLPDLFRGDEPVTEGYAPAPTLNRCTTRGPSGSPKVG